MWLLLTLPSKARTTGTHSCSEVTTFLGLKDTMLAWRWVSIKSTSTVRLAFSPLRDRLEWALPSPTAFGSKQRRCSSQNDATSLLLRLVTTGHIAYECQWRRRAARRNAE
jgi:hypothetical protein